MENGMPESAESRSKVELDGAFATNGKALANESVHNVNDLGGRAEYFAAVQHDPDEPVFNQRWEARVFGTVAFVRTVLGKSQDESRYEAEQLPAAQYFRSYYARMLAALEKQLERDGYLVDGELDAKISGQPAGKSQRGHRARGRTALAVRILARPTLPPWVRALVVPRVFGGFCRTRRPPMFAVGDAVIVRPRRDGHTRQPGYATGKTGVITEHQGAALLPDARAVRRREPPQHLYTVAFDGRELWGSNAEEGTEVRIDLYEPYLERA
jgi:nitrile hydratase subunit beta